MSYGPRDAERERRRLAGDLQRPGDQPSLGETRHPVPGYPAITRAAEGDTHYVKLQSMTAEKRFRNWAAALRFFEGNAADSDRAQGRDGPPAHRLARPRRLLAKAAANPEAAAPIAPRKRKAPCVESSPKITHVLWEPEEDKALRAAVAAQLGERRETPKWVVVAQDVPGRSAKQCRERFVNQLSPFVCKDPWSAAEDHALLTGVVVIGRRWTEIAKHLPGRTPDRVRNRFVNLQLKVPLAVGAFFGEAPDAPRRATPGVRWTNDECVRLARSVAYHDLGSSASLYKWMQIAREVGTRSAYACRQRWFSYSHEVVERAAAHLGVDPATLRVTPQRSVADELAGELDEVVERALNEGALVDGVGLVADDDALIGGSFDEEEDRAFAEMVSYYSEDPMYGLLAVEELPAEDDELDPEPAWTRSARWVVGQQSGVKFRFSPSPTAWQPPITDYMPVTRARPDAPPPPPLDTKRRAAVADPPKATGATAAVPSAGAAGGLAVPVAFGGAWARCWPVGRGFAACPATC